MTDISRDPSADVMKMASDDHVVPDTHSKDHMCRQTHSQNSTDAKSVWESRQFTSVFADVSLVILNKTISKTLVCLICSCQFQLFHSQQVMAMLPVLSA